MIPPRGDVIGVITVSSLVLLTGGNFKLSSPLRSGHGQIINSASNIARKRVVIDVAIAGSPHADPAIDIGSFVVDQQRFSVLT